MQIRGSDLSVARVLAEDEKFLTLEVAKTDDVSFTLQKDESGETVGGDRFLTLLFVHRDGGEASIWKPWEAED
jgi:hypothetical protein